MSRENILEKWEPIGKIEKEMRIEACIVDYKGFRILLKDLEKNGRNLKLQFDEYFWTYRKMPTKELEEKWSFYTVEESSYIKWFHKVSIGLRKEIAMTHYGIYGINYSIEVISCDPPAAEWIKKEEVERNLKVVIE